MKQNKKRLYIVSINGIPVAAFTTIADASNFIGEKVDSVRYHFRKKDEYWKKNKSIHRLFLQKSAKKVRTFKNKLVDNQ